MAPTIHFTPLCACAWSPRISNTTLPCATSKIYIHIHQCTNTQIQKTQHFKNIKYDISMCQIENTKIYQCQNTKCLKDPICAIFYKSRAFRDIKIKSKIHSYTKSD